MKKLLLFATLISTSPLFADTDCINSIKAAIKVNQQYVTDNSPENAENQQQQYQQQQQQMSGDFPPITLWYQIFREAKLEIKDALRNVNRLERAQTNFKYYNGLLKVAQGNYTKRDLAKLVGSSNKIKFAQYLESGGSVCLSPTKVQDKIAELHQVIEDNNAIISDVYNTKGSTYKDLVIVGLDAKEEIFELTKFYEKIMPGSADSGRYGQKFMVKDDDSIINVNPIRVMTKNKLRRVISRRNYL